VRLDEEHVSNAMGGDGTMLYPTRNHEQLAGAQLHIAVAQ